jgi:hypothetical protein
VLDSILFEARMNSCELYICDITVDQFYAGDHCQMRINSKASPESSNRLPIPPECQALHAAVVILQHPPNHHIPAGSFWRQTSPTGQKGSAGGPTVPQKISTTHKPSYDRAIRPHQACSRQRQPAEPIGHREGRALVQADGVQVEAGPAGRVGCVGRVGAVTDCSINREPGSNEPHAFHPVS